MTDKVILSICIVTWNTRAFLDECLSSLRKYPCKYHTEVIVVDNSSTDATADMVEKSFPEVRLIRNEENTGYAEANNQAARVSTGKYLLFLNPDTVLHENALTESVNFLKSRPKASSLGCRLLSPDGSTQLSVRGFPDPLSVLFEYTKLWKLLPKSQRLGAYRMRWFDYNTTAQVDQPMGSYLMVTTQAWERVGPFDTEFPIFFNEVDWCMRAKRLCGYEIWYSGAIAITHYGGSSTRQVKPAMIKESHRSFLNYYDIHYKSRTSKLIFRLIQLAVTLDEHVQLLRSQS